MHVSLQPQATIFFCYFLSGIDKETLHNTKNAKFYCGWLCEPER